MGVLELKYKKNIPKRKFGMHSNNPALHFLVQAPKLLKNDAILCLIQPSGPLLYQKDEDFKRAVFGGNKLLQILDFTKLADVLWGEKTVATAAIFLQKCLPDKEDVVHIVANRTFSNVNKIFLELGHYDFHIVTQDVALSNRTIWKSNLIGGGRLVGLVDRLFKIRTLKKFLETKLDNGWKAGEGFIYSENGKPHNYITGQPYIPAKALTKDKLDEDEIRPCETELFHRPTSELIYTPPHILIRANIGVEKLIAHISDKYLVFRNKIIGIHAPQNQRNELEKLLHYLRDESSLLRFWILNTSSQIKVKRHTVPMTEDFMNIPYPDNLAEIKTSSSEKILINGHLEKLILFNT